MRFVTVKLVEQQDIQSVHRIRAILQRHRTEMRGLLVVRGLTINCARQKHSGAQCPSCFGPVPLKMQELTPAPNQLQSVYDSVRYSLVRCRWGSQGMGGGELTSP